MNYVFNNITIITKLILYDNVCIFNKYFNKCYHINILITFRYQNVGST